jgi:hypothetical protein
MMSKTRATPRKHDAYGQPLLKVGDIVRSIPKHLDPDPGTVVRILQVNANGAYLVEVQWFTWNSGAHTQEYITELELVRQLATRSLPASPFQRGARR